MFAWLLILSAAALLSGCSTQQVRQLQLERPADIPLQRSLAQVPFIAQEEYQCGPASLAMVLQSAGVAVTDQQLVEQVYLPSRKGSLQAEMLAASRRYGVPSFRLAPTLDAVLQEVAAGHPVVVLQNLSFAWYPVWHYAVVVGYDLATNTITLHSGHTERMEMSLYAFERTWARGGYWAMMAIAPTSLPATVRPQDYAVSISALERLHPAAAKQAYETALTQWPEDKLLLLGAGNSAYALGEFTLAAQMYRTATALHPDFADAWNNLAQVQHEQGQQDEAARAVAKAVALGGPRLSQYRELQQAIQKWNQSPPQPPPPHPPSPASAAAAPPGLSPKPSMVPSNSALEKSPPQ
jgi:tetratricopeptide (TPR) repeat protein